MANYRMDRISEEVRQGVDAIIREMNDPRITGTYSVTRADVTRDLKYAKVFISILEDDKSNGIIEALGNAAGYIRRELGRRIQLRALPTLQFVRDQNIAYGAHMMDVFRSLEAETNRSRENEND